MKDGDSAKASISQRITNELREFAITGGYFYVYFTALAYFKAAILEAHYIPFAPFAFAAVKAMICAKFLLVGRMFHLGERFKTPPLIWPTLHKSLVFLVLLVALNALEEVVVGAIHHRRLADSMADFGGGTVEQLIATSFLGLLILIPFFAFRALGDVVGERILIRLFFEPRRRVDNNWHQTRRTSASGRSLGRLA